MSTNDFLYFFLLARQMQILSIGISSVKLFFFQKSRLKNHDIRISRFAIYWVGVFYLSMAENNEKWVSRGYPISMCLYIRARRHVVFISTNLP